MQPRCLLATSLLMTIVVCAGEAVAASGGHQDAVRDFLIVKHCGFESDDVRAGFRIEIISLIGDGKVSASTARAERDAAAEEVRRQWRNRGMGSADPRCLTEGRAAVDRFLTVLNSAD
jgi:hypothetical protein